MNRYRTILAMTAAAMLFAGCATKTTPPVPERARKGWAVQIDHDTACFEGPRVEE